MQFFNRRAIAAYALIVFLVALMTGCGGGSSADNKAAATVTEVDIFPTSISMVPGDVVPLFAQALNSSGNQVFTQTITFNSSNSKIQIGTLNGQTLLCAGTWDNPSVAVVCTPTTTVPDTANITASAGGVTSPTTVASVHLAITSVTVTPTAPACTAEAGTQIFKAHAFNGATEITSTVGTFSWQSSQTGVGTVPATGDTGFTDQATVTAVHPGNSNITARIGSVSPIASTPAVFQQCLVNSIEIKNTIPNPNPGNDTDTHFEIATGATRAMIVTVTDSTGATLTTLPSLNWNTTQPSVAAVGSTGSVSGVAPGAVGISASCLPNNCNIGTSVNVTSNLVTGTVTGTPSTNATAYVTCTNATAGGACNTGTDADPQVKLFPINDTTLGTAITLPHTPNSMMINPQNSKLYIGSEPINGDNDAGLMVVDANANSLSATVNNAPGKVLAVAPNGNAVVTSNDADAFLYNGSTVQTLLSGTTHILNATAAAFSPDSGKLIITTSSGQVWFEVAGATPTSRSPGGSLVGAAFLPSGSLQAASAVGTTQFFGIDAANTTGASVGCGGLIQPLPNLDALYAANPGGGAVCVIDNPPAANSFPIGAFSATQIALSSDGTHAFLIGGGSVIDNTVGTTTTTTINLGAASTTGGVATNGTLYVGSADSKVHVITFPGAADTPITTTIPADLVVAKH